MASKSNGLESSAWARAPPSGSVWSRIGKAIYDPEEKSFLGRTAKRWGIVIIFYLVFYAVLAAMFAICMAGLFAQLDDKVPYFTLEKSLIGVNPGVDYRPRPADEVQLKYDRDNNTVLEAYKRELDNFVQPRNDNQTECVAADNYGIPDTPCIYIKLNKIYGWEPDYYSAGDLPADMPDDLKETIKNNTLTKQVWVSCWDEKYNSTKIEYPWGRGLPSTSYPYRNENDYLSPVVAVKITPAPEAAQSNAVKDEDRGIVVRCRAWAKNIVYNHSIKEASGYARIRLLVEDKKTE